MKPLKDLLRTNIYELSKLPLFDDGRNEGFGLMCLDANETPYNHPYNRYPDCKQSALKQQLARVMQVDAEQIWLGNGSGDIVDMIYKCFCNPGKDNVVAIEPTRSLYRKAANVFGVECRQALLEADFKLSADTVLSLCDDNTKVVWVCSPNSVDGNSLERGEIETIVELFDGIVVVDESYSDFSRLRPFRLDISAHPNIISIGTMSKAWGCAAARVAMAFSNKDISDVFERVGWPYSISSLDQKCVLDVLVDPFEVGKCVKMLAIERQRMVEAFRLLPFCNKVFESDANFLLARMDNAKAVHSYLLEQGIIVKDVSGMPLCENCLRVAIGTKNENNLLLSALRQYGRP